MKRFFYTISAILLAGILFSSCQKNENISPIPAITFSSFTPYVDSAVVEINFQDGDGDIGYPADDATAPYDFWAEYLYQDSAASNKAGAPIYLAYYNPNVSQPLTNDTVYFLYHIPDITPAGKNKSLKGLIKVVIPYPWFIPQYLGYSPGYPNIIEYKIWIVDRAGHKSNAIITPPVNTLPY